MSHFTHLGEIIVGDFEANGVVHPYGNLRLYSADELAALGITVDADTPVDAKVARKSDLANRRYEAEVGGIVLNGMQIDTDRASQSMLTSAYNFLRIKPDGSTIQFKAASGFVTLTFQQVSAIALAVGGHVQACFAHEAELSALIDIAEDPAAVDIDTGWPT